MFTDMRSLDDIFLNGGLEVVKLLCTWFRVEKLLYLVEKEPLENLAS